MGIAALWAPRRSGLGTWKGASSSLGHVEPSSHPVRPARARRPPHGVHRRQRIHVTRRIDPGIPLSERTGTPHHDT